MLQWKPRLRLALIVLAVVTVALALGWSDVAQLFLEW
jgi:hypothetical protein